VDRKCRGFGISGATPPPHSQHLIAWHSRIKHKNPMGHRMSTIFRSQLRRRFDTNVMFMVSYADGRSAYFTAAPQETGLGDFLARSIASERQASGEIPAGRIIAVRRVR
jgi:hypothetical protein